MNEELRRLIEPHVPPTKARLAMLKRAKELGLRTGVIIAPIMPPVKQRPDVEADLDAIMRELADINVGQVFGEMLHIRGSNIKRLEKILGEKLVINRELDRWIGGLFESLLRKYDLNGEYWYEYKQKDD
jgi:DNA repair photolyase